MCDALIGPPTWTSGRRATGGSMSLASARSRAERDLIIAALDRNTYNMAYRAGARRVARDLYRLAQRLHPAGTETARSGAIIMGDLGGCSNWRVLALAVGVGLAAGIVRCARRTMATPRRACARSAHSSTSRRLRVLRERLAEEQRRLDADRHARAVPGRGDAQLGAMTGRGRRRIRQVPSGPIDGSRRRPRPLARSAGTYRHPNVRRLGADLRRTDAHAAPQVRAGAGLPVRALDRQPHRWSDTACLPRYHRASTCGGVARHLDVFADRPLRPDQSARSRPSCRGCARAVRRRRPLATPSVTGRSSTARVGARRRRAGRALIQRVPRGQCGLHGHLRYKSRTGRRVRVPIDPATGLQTVPTEQASTPCRPASRSSIRRTRGVLRRRCVHAQHGARRRQRNFGGAARRCVRHQHGHGPCAEQRASFSLGTSTASSARPISATRCQSHGCAYGKLQLGTCASARLSADAKAEPEPVAGHRRDRRQPGPS